MAERRKRGADDQGDALNLRGVTQCYITDRKTLPAGETLIDAVARNLAQGPDWIQLREKDLEGRELFMLARSVLALPNPRGVKILVNSRVDVALAAEAAGAHLPADSPPPRLWREFAPEGFLIGVSCHTLDEVLRAEQEDADYVVFGPVFEPRSKPANISARGLAELTRVSRTAKIPVLALGGITRANLDACINAGAAGVAGISLYQRQNC